MRRRRPGGWSEAVDGYGKIRYGERTWSTFRGTTSVPRSLKVDGLDNWLGRLTVLDTSNSSAMHVKTRAGRENHLKMWPVLDVNPGQIVVSLPGGWAATGGPSGALE